jgi:hypothetical protein
MRHRIYGMLYLVRDTIHTNFQKNKHIRTSQRSESEPVCLRIAGNRRLVHLHRSAYSSASGRSNVSGIKKVFSLSRIIKKFAKFYRRIKRTVLSPASDSSLCTLLKK